MGTIVVGLLIVFYLFFYSGKDSKVAATRNAKSLERAHICVKSYGGFDRLCIDTLKYATIGANMNIDSFKKLKYVLDKEPSLSDVNKLRVIEKQMECLILVEIHCIGINYADCCIRWGFYESANKYVGLPITPGFEFSGKIVKIIGSQSSDKTLIKFKEGDEVFGVSLFGAYSTHILVPNHQLFHKPKNIDMSEAAGFLAVLLTAYYALFVLAAPSMLPHIEECVNNKTLAYFSEANSANTKDENKNDKESTDAANGDSNNNNKNNFPLRAINKPIKCVLIHSASGGVGSMLVQLCKKIARFDTVVGVVGGSHKIKLAKELGCDFVIDRKDTKNLKNGNIFDQMEHQFGIQSRYGGFDVIFDANGVATLSKSYEFLKPTGQLVVYGFHSMLPHNGVISPLQWLKLGYNAFFKTPKFNPMELVSENKSILGFNLSFLFKRTDILHEFMANALPWIENGDIKMSKVTKYKFEDVASAHRDIQSGKTVGKLVLVTPKSNISV